MAFDGVVEQHAAPPGVAPYWRCVLIGDEPLLAECADMLIERGHAVVAIVSRRAALRDWAGSRDIPVPDDASALATASIAAFSHLFSITNLAVLSPLVLGLPTTAAINFHDGVLPDYAGLNTPVWALLRGERTHGITWHLMTAAVDGGDVLLQRRFDIDAGESAHSINTKCFAAAIESFPLLIDRLAASSLSPMPQPAGPSQRFGRTDRPPVMATIDWNQAAEAVVGFVRALDYGGHANPLGSPKLVIDGDLLLVRSAAVGSVRSGAAPGTVTHADANRISIATATHDVDLLALTDTDGIDVSLATATTGFGLRTGTALVRHDDKFDAQVSYRDARGAPHERWWRTRLASIAPLTLPATGTMATAGWIDSPVAGGHPYPLVVAALVGFLARVTDRAAFDIGYSDPVLSAGLPDLRPWFASQLPLGAHVDFALGLDTVALAVAEQVAQLHRRCGHAADLIARSPELAGRSSTLPVAVIVVDRLEDAAPLPDADLTIVLGADGTASRWHYGTRIESQTVRALQRGFAVMLSAALSGGPVLPLGLLPLMTADELDTVTGATGDDGPPTIDGCVHEQFVAQVARTPGAPAVTSRGVTLSYAELDARSNLLARHLRALGVTRGVLVGLHVDRSVAMLVALIAIHKAGGAYVPLDPAYPADRIAHMIADSRASVIVTQASLAASLPHGGATLVCIDGDSDAIAACADTPLDLHVQPDDLAYVIYTSGSTGLPKGVMVEHRNVANFFAGMDRVIEPGGTWLAVTSLSFDISVLELCWTVARGCHVVIATGDEMFGAGPAPLPAPRPVAFSLFYFASADGVDAADQYRLLLDGARFADTHDFAAVWTPERHFHAFGGLFPNPSVTSAAIAAVTKRVAIRGGSVVLPLHHPVRIAEEWSLVDNLSNGRVGIAFASGWQPNDFILRPEAFADKTAVLMDGIDTVRALWRGERRSFPGITGAPVSIAIYPRPVQAELPVWITSAGNPDTFAAAGTAGAFVLTHLLGQTVDELAEKLAAYRAARQDAGHPGDGHVTLMLHSFVGEDADAVRAAVRAPLLDYLRTSTNLVKDFAWSFPAFKRRPGMADDALPDLATLDADEMAALLDFAFDRYFDTGGLFGTPAQCLDMVARVRAAGVDEIACLIDFGVPVQQVLDHLPHLDTLRRLATVPPPRTNGLPADTLAGLMRRHGVDHLQCTPSMAQMLVNDADTRIGLAALDHMLVGGEAFPVPLAAELAALVGGAVSNMYGPTETTIWSTTQRVQGREAPVPLGRPLAHQQVYIMDSRMQPVLPGMPGELVIAGRGVVRGYLRRPELTAERFAVHPFDRAARVYRTGDLASRRPDGTIDFLGRLDHQVKIRGHRIEPGEIEAVLCSHADVERAVVIAREDAPGDVRLIAYYVPASGAAPAAASLRTHMSALLPASMIPSHLIALDDLPQTPNGKVNRAALPSPDVAAVARAPDPTAAFAPPSGDVEERIAGVWRDVLKLAVVGTRDNFFDLGGHSLLAVQVHRRLRETVGTALPLTDIFRFPTITSLAEHLTAGAGADELAARQGRARAEGRRLALRQRQGRRYAATVSEPAE